MARIAIDMDGVLADFIGTANTIAKEVWGLDLKYEDIKAHRYSEVIKEHGIELSNDEIYGQIMAEGIFRNLKPMPGAIQAVKKLAEEGHEIAVLTKALSSDRSKDSKRQTTNQVISEKMDWLASHLGNIHYQLIAVSEMSTKHWIDAHILVDDDPRALDHPTAITVCVAHPWNKDYRDSLGGLQETIDSMNELPAVVKRVEKFLQTAEEIKTDLFEHDENLLGIKRL